MTDYIVKDTSLTGVADAIRAKTGNNSSLTFPTGFETAIDNIETSAEAYEDALEETYGSGQTPAPSDYKYVEITSLNATENGTYTAPEGTAYGSVVVNTFPETPTDSVLFYSTYSFSLSVYNSTKNWDGTLYYSTDRTNWAEWYGTTEIVSALNGNWHTLYLRGVGNTVIVGTAYNNGRFVISSKPIKCVGNLNNLLDYTTTPILAPYCFFSLFRDCSTVDFSVELSATVLSEDCYCQMFYGCSSMVEPPKLPATSLAQYCYYYMFASCKSLAAIPELKATQLEKSCYNYMFSDCANIKISTTQTGEYQTEYRIPTSGIGIDATNALVNMFANTGGTFVGTPTINTTYYTSNTIIPAT